MADESFGTFWQRIYGWIWALGWKRAIPLCVAGVVLPTTGVCIFYTPKYEVLYSLRNDVFQKQGRGNWFCLYSMEIGNTRAYYSIFGDFF